MSALDEVEALKKANEQPQAPTQEPVPQQEALVKTDNFKDEKELIGEAVKQAGQQAVTLKDVIDVGVTGEALKKEGVLDELTDKKEQELKEDALAKVIASEAERIKRETDRLTEEGKKQLQELRNQIEQAEAEKQQLEKQASKEQAYFNSHKAVLKYAGCREAMSMRYMQTMSAIGFVVMCIVKLLFAPLLLIGLFLETLMDIIGGVTGAIKANATKIIVSILLAIVIGGVCFGAYYGITALF